MSPTRTAPELITSLKSGWNDAVQQWWDQSQAALDPWMQAWDTIMPGVAGQTRGMPSRRHRVRGPSSPCGCDSEHGCRCGDIHQDWHRPDHEHDHDQHDHDQHDQDQHDHDQHDHDQHDRGHDHGHADTSCCRGNPCHCCIPDADIVLQARAGEQRVVPFLLRNPWRRERAVTIVVGPWQVCNGGRLEVQSVVDVGESLTLQPCERRVVRLRVLVRGICEEKGGTNEKRGTKDDTKDQQQNDNLFGCDVEECASAYADVRFEGCARPQRVAVVVHPAACDAVELPCDCGCCD